MTTSLMQLASSTTPSCVLLAALVGELERLAGDESAYNEKLAWRKKSLQQLAPGGMQIRTLSMPGFKPLSHNDVDCIVAA